jgi:hypothetical protein
MSRQPGQRFFRITKRVNLDIRLNGGGELGENIPVRNPVVENDNLRHDAPGTRLDKFAGTANF